MALSDQLTDLASRTKQLEDAAAATKAEDRAKLEKQREKLHSKMHGDRFLIAERAKLGSLDELSSLLTAESR